MMGVFVEDFLVSVFDFFFGPGIFFVVFFDFSKELCNHFFGALELMLDISELIDVLFL